MPRPPGRPETYYHRWWRAFSIESANAAALDQLLDSARRGPSGALVIRGEAGMGKTALLDYAATAAQDFLVVRFTGLEPERDIAFAALHRLLMPILHQIKGLPEPQRDAMNAALGLAAGQPGNNLLVGLGVVNLAANAARARERLLCLIDDAHWVDRESIEALAFWGRRLQADGIALIFAERSGPEAVRALEGFPTLEIDGLTDEAAHALLAAEAGFGGDRQVAERIVTEARGNPLALVEFSKDPRPDQLIGATANLQPLPLSRRLEERFARQARSLPVDTQILLLLAAADSTADTAFVLRAASILGVKTEAAGAAETAGLVVLGPPSRSGTRSSGRRCTAEPDRPTGGRPTKRSPPPPTRRKRVTGGRGTWRRQQSGGTKKSPPSWSGARSEPLSEEATTPPPPSSAARLNSAHPQNGRPCAASPPPRRRSPAGRPSKCTP